MKTSFKHEQLNKNMLTVIDNTENIPLGQSFCYFEKYESQLDKIRKLSIHSRIFRKIKRGSLRFGIINCVIVSLKSGILNFPKIFRNWGLLNSIFFLILNAYIASVCMSLYIKIGFYSGKKNLIVIIESYYGKFIAKILLMIIIFMNCLMIIIYILISYEILLTILGYFYKSYIIDLKNPKNNYKLFSLIWRFGFIFLNFIIMIPIIITRKYYRWLKFFSIIFIMILIYIIIIVIIESPYYYFHYKNKVFLSEKNNYDLFYSSYYYEWIKSISTILLSFYVQVSMFNILGFIKNATIKRCRKIKNLSIFYEFLLYLFLGIAGYISLGKDRQVKLIIEREPIDDNHNDLLMKIGVFIYLFANMISTTMFSYSLSSYTNILLKLQQDSKKSKIIIWSWFCFCSIMAFVYPNIEMIFEFAGGFVGNFIGFMLPIFIFYKIPKAVKDTSKLKHLRNCLIFIYLISIPFMQLITKLLLL